jgi:hypothetical protein
MNIFVLDLNTEICAQYHNDRHVVKMILETTQLLNNALVKCDSSYVGLYKPTHVNHPASIWVSESYINFAWLMNLGLELCKEYTYRYGKVHKCHSIIEHMRDSSSRKNLACCDITPFKLCMPDQYKIGDAVQSYRAYYNGAKRHIAKWKNREQPYWWI